MYNQQHRLSERSICVAFNGARQKPRKSNPNANKMSIKRRETMGKRGGESSSTKGVSNATFHSAFPVDSFVCK
jgi:hypothetical protein